ncbi:MAG TPA: CorA family divalent cation transporter, partial [Anaerolineae bacterium]|nr:CorA family divalent cation transporter [Anaerolineae bacterium]
STEVYFRDVYDHAFQVMDTVETFRDMLSGMLEMYLSSVSNRMNEIMKVLTIIATLFIPLTFITGVYGMNFKHMPELEWRWGYLLVWVVMFVVAALMLLYFRRKKWL